MNFKVSTFLTALFAILAPFCGSGFALESTTSPAPSRAVSKAAGTRRQASSRLAGLHAQAKEAPTSEALEKAKQREILGTDESSMQDERVIRFIQLVALPLLVCLVLILLLRRGLFGG